MEASKVFTLEIFKKPEPPRDESMEIVDEIHAVCRSLEIAFDRFRYGEDEDLVDAAIYEIEALKARYRYLIKLAKSKNVEAGVVSVDFAFSERVD